jgi:hypothetical protein
LTERCSAAMFVYNDVQLAGRTWYKKNSRVARGKGGR